jgi:5-methylcytosine-specific restriction endonuclease McrA
MKTTDPATTPAERPLILAVDVTGAPRGWMSWQYALGCQVAGRVERSLGDYAFTFRGGWSRLTGERSQITISSILALRGRNPRGWEPLPPTLDNTLLFLRDRNLCCYCGARKNATAMTRDHVRPLSRGGGDHWTNVVTACRHCNQRKDARTPEEAGMLMLYVPYVPSRYEGMILRNRRILADQMELLVSLLPENSRLLAE